ncbi:MAG TPA: hypothetical protein VNX28_08570 [Gemmataceae bacterium]|jgi:hypothetical protein|nr:hypothetical protein [Gemmataceae bacterium]
MSTVFKDKKTPLLPPEEKFWERYSPHHELPLAGVTSFFIHGLVIGIMVLAAFWYLFQRDSETNKPPSMDMVQVAGGGDAFAGKGGEPGLPGDNPMPTEFVPSPMTNVKETSPNSDTNLKDAPPMELDIPAVSFAQDAKQDVESVLAKMEKEASEQAKKDTAPVQQPKKTAGSGNPKGIGGKGGSGGGPGKGTKGSGLGSGGLGGRQTKAEIYARRWGFAVTGVAKDHIAWYIAMGVKVAIRAPNGQDFLFIQDLRRRPVDLVPGIIPDPKDVVTWENKLPASLERLAVELKLKYVPRDVIISLPKERQERLAEEELRFAQKMGRRSDQIVFTTFDFQLRDGHYEPMVVKQE